jgi:hypothetical protein
MGGQSIGHSSRGSRLALRLCTERDAEQRGVRAGVRLVRVGVHSIGQTALRSAAR